MEKRTVKLGPYNTADYGWTLTGCTLSAPEMKQNYVEKPSGDGSWDLSTVLSNGIPRYKDRSLVVTLECSEGGRDEREDKINDMITLLDGMKVEIVLPDRPEHFLLGRLSVAVGYSDLAHAQVTITGTCEPWLYSRRETVYSAAVTDQDGILHIDNKGRKVVMPTLTVEGTVGLTYENGESIQLAAGSHRWSGMMLTPGRHILAYAGNGKLTVAFREAVLR